MDIAMNINEIRSKSSDELKSLLLNRSIEFVSLSFEGKVKKNNNKSTFGLVKSDIARILTVLNERRGKIDV